MTSTETLRVMLLGLTKMEELLVNQLAAMSADQDVERTVIILAKIREIKEEALKIFFEESMSPGSYPEFELVLPIRPEEPSNN